jgi:hypothetical protein
MEAAVNQDARVVRFQEVKAVWRGCFLFLLLTFWLPWDGSSLAAGAGVEPAAGQVIVSLPVKSAKTVSIEQDVRGVAGFADMLVRGEPGQPALPVQSVQVLLPPDADPRSVTAAIEEAQSETLPDAWEVAPVPPVAIGAEPGRAIWPQGRTIVNGRDVAVYSTDAFLPASFLGRVLAGQRREWRLAEIEVYPYRYNPVTKKLLVLRSGRLLVRFKRVQVMSSAVTPPGGVATRTRDAVRASVINFDEIALSYDAPRASSLLALQPARYVILTRSTIVSSSTQLANFVVAKQAQGFVVSVVTEDTWGGGTGNTAAENIRAWLAANYQSLNIEYVLLIGNPAPSTGDVPMKMCYPQNYDLYYSDCPTDYYYAELTGNWDLDGDGKYGEYDHDCGPGGADRNCEVVVGRIPYYGVMADLDAILAKIIDYGNTPSADAAWRRKALLPMKPSDYVTPGYQLGEEIKTSVLIPKGDWTWHRVYESTYDLTPPPESTPCSEDIVTAAWTCSSIGATFWWTHGNATYAASVMDLSHAAALNNNRPAFTFQCSCLNAQPEISNNLAYSLLKNGGVNTISATRVSWYWVGQTSFAGRSSNASMTFEYAKRMITSQMAAGDALQGLKADIAPEHEVMWMNYLDFNVYGDPAMGLYTFRCMQPTLPASATEGDGVLAGQGRVTVTPAPTNDLTVALTSSDTSEVTVPPTVTVATGQTNATFDVTIVDDTVLDGDQSATITAAASGYLDSSATIVVHDNETATLTVTVPATATEGQGVLTNAGTVTVSAPVAANVTVNLSSSDTTEVIVPSTVTVLTGQTAAAFSVIIVDDNQIDGPQTATVTAHVPNWTDGSASTTVLDNENTNLTVSLPVSAYEGDGVLTDAGRVSMSGTLPSDLLINLDSSDTSEVIVPSLVTISAGQTSAVFDVTIVDDTETDGMQTATVTASATGFVSGSGNIAVKDNDVHQFALSDIASPQSAGTPFAVSIAALDINGSTITVYQTAITLTGTGDGGPDSVQPTTITAWGNGVWTGAVHANTVDTNVRLTADDGAGHTGVSNPFDVQLGPLDHFGWSFVPSPQHQDISFPVTITAQDAGNNTVTDFTGTVGLSGFSGSGVTTNTILDSPTHTSYWYSEGPYTIGYAFTPDADIMVTHVRHYSGNKVSIWTDSGDLLVSQTVTSIPETWVDTPLPVPLQLSAGTCYRVGLYTDGTTYYYGREDMTDTFSNGTINQAYSTDGDAFPTWISSWRWVFVDLRYTVGTGEPVAVVPTNSDNFVSGVWTGSVTVLEAATNVVLVASDGAGYSGTSTVFDAQAFVDLAVTMTGAPDPVVARSNLTYSVTVTNSGPDKAARVVLTDLLPTGVTFVLATSSEGNCTQIAGTVTCSLGTVSNGAVATATIVVQPAMEGILTNTVTATSSGTDSNLTNNVATTITTVQGVGVLGVVSGINICNAVPGASAEGVSFGNVMAGRSYTYQASGCIVYSAGGTGYSDPDGYTSTNGCDAFPGPPTIAPGSFICPVFYALSLVGKIGGGSCLQLGKNGTFVAPSSGELVLYFNDDYFGDNSGSWNACITAPSDLAFSGPAGGPFNPPSQVYTLTNSGTASLDWSATNTATWVSLSATSGTLAAGTSINVTVTINSDANSLAVGVYSNTVTFINTTNGNGTTTRGITLTINPCVASPSGLVGWWPAEGTGADVVGGNTATLLNGATFGPGKVGQGFSLDGVDDRITASDSPALDFGPGVDFSIEAWIQAFPADRSYGVMTILDKRYAPADYECLGIGFYLQDGRLALQLCDTLTPYAWSCFVSSGPNLEDGQFHHVAVTVQRNSTTGGNLYVDGQVVLTFDPTSQAGDLSTTEPLRLGNHASPWLNCYFKGIIDEMSIYRRALSTDEIAAIYAGGSAGKCVVPTLAVTPVDGLITSGPQGGPFSPASRGYTLSNIGVSPLDWSASKSTGWVTLSATGGSLAAGSNTTVTVSINTNANSLAVGGYSDTVTFTNTTNGNGTTNRTVSLTVNLPSWEQWQLNHFGCTNCPQAAPTADPDGDGQNNLAEFLAGTDPTNSASALRIVDVTQESDDVRITWTTAGGRTNAVQATAGDVEGGYTTNFIDISGLIIISGSGDTTTNYVDVGGATNAPSRYYRIRLVP